tara:strand:+ start:1487 stop:1741 length:255 start_codon:yes stop_codon:yes gene_type:complete
MDSKKEEKGKYFVRVKDLPDNKKPYVVYAVFGEDESNPINTLKSRYNTYLEAMNDNSIRIQELVGYYMSWKEYKEYLFKTGFLG